MYKARAIGWTILLLAALSGCGGSKNENGDSGVNTGGTGGDGVQVDGSTTGTGGSTPGANCGNGIPEGKEECDDKNTIENDGCTQLCEYSCHTDSDCTKDPCRGADAKCETTTHKCNTGTSPKADGTSCGDNMSCYKGTCEAVKCGNGITQGTEECDDGNKDDVDGCTHACKYTCLSSDKTRNCIGVCDLTGTCDDASHKCKPGKDALADNTLCNDRTGYCVSGVCVASNCGDGTKEPNEECDEGKSNGGAACTATCTKAVCGDSIISGDEQCDDGNANYLDGCDPKCKLELVYRGAQMVPVKGDAPDYCIYSKKNYPQGTANGNAIGKLMVNLEAFGIDPNASSGEGTSITGTSEAVNAGGMAFLFHLLEQDDPTVQKSDPAIQIGASVGVPDNTVPGGGPDAALLPDGSWYGQLPIGGRLDFPMKVWRSFYDDNFRPLNLSWAKMTVEGGKAYVDTTEPMNTGFRIMADDDDADGGGLGSMIDIEGDFILRNVVLHLEVDPPRSKIKDPPKTADWLLIPETSGGGVVTGSGASGFAADGGISIEKATGVMCGAMDIKLLDSIPVPKPSVVINQLLQNPELGDVLGLDASLCPTQTNDPNIKLTGCLNGVEDLKAGKCSSILTLLTYGCSGNPILDLFFGGPLFPGIGAPDIDVDKDGKNDAYSIVLNIATQRVRLSTNGFGTGDPPAAPIGPEDLKK